MLPLDTYLRIGIQTIHRRTEPAAGPWWPEIDELVELVELVDRNGYHSLWVGDHVSFTIPILDPLARPLRRIAQLRDSLFESVDLAPIDWNPAVAIIHDALECPLCL